MLRPKDQDRTSQERRGPEAHRRRAQSNGRSHAKRGAKATRLSGYGNVMAIRATIPAWRIQAAVTQPLAHRRPRRATGAPSSMSTVIGPSGRNAPGWSASDPANGE